MALAHGLGEHVGRYEEIASAFADRGVEVCGVDLPGFGRSTGRRGHFSGLWEAIVVILEMAEFLRGRLPPGAPLGIAGHSFGAFLSLAFLGRFPDVFTFAWISSPLLEPGRNVGKWRRRVALAAEPWLPWIRLDNGVRSEACSRDTEALERLRADGLMHRKVSLRLGRMLIDEAEAVRLRPLQGDLKLLMTQGLADRVCPPEVGRRYFESIGLRDKRLEEFPGLLHEPFRDVGGEVVLRVVGEWLDGLLGAWAAGMSVRSRSNGQNRAAS
ncbi:MAG: alpha/beta fold hydrolase [Verrucomicrobiae bacterium]|nr:alpha/beta fold hydrolase [Verrucomicrobiae bacterium]